MIKKLKDLVLILILLISPMVIYLSWKKIQLNNYILSSSFFYASKHGDTLIINYPFDKNELKDLLFSVNHFSGGHGFSMFSIKDGEQAFGRKFKKKDSIIIYKGHQLFPGDSFEDTITYNSKQNLFEIVSNRFKFKNEGFVRSAILYEDGIIYVDSVSKIERLDFAKPIILAEGESYDYISENKIVVTVYYVLIFLLVTLGLLYAYLSYLLKTKFVDASAK